ncbi:nodulin-related protein 1-like [Macadamia integrifolia]|uniref:nodulin-related protein 1-like n=1 Tax=Macadamia integrifolia TaxID=60698 RepID=UPI001C4FFA42|nr:nodulin-related protein 1-like [Macadamia integrifolia]
MDSHPHEQHTTHGHKHQPSKSELISSAKVIAEAAKAGLHHETNKIDKGKVAGAAADLMGAASYYGKLEEKGVGKYVEKAEQYLHHYHSSQSSSTSTTTTNNSGHSTTTTSTQSHSHSSGGGGNHSESGGFEDYIKLAQGFLKKH